LSVGSYRWWALNLTLCCGKMNRRFTPAEFAGIYFIYGFCDGNSSWSISKTFPNRRIPNKQVFSDTPEIRKRGQVFHVTKNTQHSGLLLWKSAYWTWYSKDQLKVFEGFQSNWWIHIECMNHTWWRAIVLPFATCACSSNGWLRYCAQFFRWMISHPRIINRILFSDEAHFSGDGVSSSRNRHLWSADNPQGTVERAFHRWF
jgi:hypothetical protein